MCRMKLAAQFVTVGGRRRPVTQWMRWRKERRVLIEQWGGEMRWACVGVGEQGALWAAGVAIGEQRQMLWPTK